MKATVRQKEPEPISTYLGGRGGSSWEEGGRARLRVGFYRVPRPSGEPAHSFCVKLSGNQQFSPGKLPQLIKQFPLSSVMFCFHLVLSKIEMIRATGSNYLTS